MADELTDAERNAVWQHLDSMYGREGALLGAVFASATVAVGLITLSISTSSDVVRFIGAFGPSLAFGLFLYLRVQSRITGAYIRRLESALRGTNTAQSLSIHVPNVGRVRFPFFGAVQVALYAPENAGNRSNRALFVVMSWLVAVFLLTGSFVSAWRLDAPVSVATIAVLAVVYVIELVLYVKARVPEPLERAIAAADLIVRNHRAGRPPQASAGWTLSKALLTRPMSLPKGLWIVWGFVTGVGLAGVDASSMPARLAALGIGILCVEVLVAQARYLVNDYRDQPVDAVNPDPHANRRLPGDLTATQTLILAASVPARLGAAYFLTELVPAADRDAIRATVVALVVVVALYEALRDRLRLVAIDGLTSGHHEQVALPPAVRVLAESTFVAVALGYVVRVGLGLWIGSAGAVPAAAFWMVLAGAGAAHYAIVLMGWSLEATGALFTDGLDRFGTGLVGKPHLRYLAHRAALLDEGARYAGPGTPAAEDSLRTTRIITTPAFRGSSWFQGRVFWPATVGAVVALAAVIVVHGWLGAAVVAGVVAVLALGGITVEGWASTVSQPARRSPFIRVLAALAVAAVTVTGIATVGRESLYALGAALVGLLLYGDTRRTARTSWNELRLLPHEYRRHAYEVVASLVSLPVWLLFGPQAQRNLAKHFVSLETMKRRIGEARAAGVPYEKIVERERPRPAPDFPDDEAYGLVVVPTGVDDNDTVTTKRKMVRQ